MKKLQNLSCIVFTILLLASCEKKESEENKPAEQIPEEIIEPDPGQIRKVIRYNNAGAIKDSILFRYDNKNQLAKIEYGDFVNGKYKNVVEYSYSKDQNGQDVISEKNYLLNNSQYDLVFTVSYFKVLGWKDLFVSVKGQSSFNYQIGFDSAGFVKNVMQTQVKKNQDYYLDLRYELQSNNVSEIIPDSYPDLGSHAFYEYYSQPYNHELFTSIYESGNYQFWNNGLVNLFDLRYKFIGNRNQNLLKKMKIANAGFPLTFTETNYEYEFNTLSLVSKINTSITSATGTTTPMATKYEIFYY